MAATETTLALSSPRLHQTLVLPTGRKIGFATYGDTSGKPVVYFHGTPSTRLEPGPLHQLCQALKIHLIAPDRPGMGLSTLPSPRTEHSIANYPADIAALTSHLHLPRFSMLAVSGGAPYAISCARSLPPSSLASVGIVAGSAPPEAGSAGLTWLGKVGPVLWRWPGLMERLLRGQERAAHDPDRSVFAASQRQIWAWLSERDREACELDADWLFDCGREVYRQGAGGAAWELYLMIQPWGFGCEEVGFRGTKIWCGTDDVNTPLNMARYMAQRLPGAKLEELPGLTHYTIYTEKNMRPILEELIAGV